MKKHVIIKGVALASAFGALLFFINSARARNRSLPSSMLVLGDSQVKRHLGKAYEDEFSELEVNYYGKEGATPQTYLTDPEVVNAVAQLPCADIIVIQLGDNGIAQDSSHITNLVDKLVEKCPNASLFWAGPMRAVAPTVQSNYVDMKDSTSPRYLPNYNRLRQVWDTRLRNALQPTKVEYVSNFDMQANQPINSNFSNNRGGDGIHLTKDSAQALAQLMRPVVEDHFRG